MPETQHQPDRRKDPRSPAWGQVRVGWNDPLGGFHVCQGVLADESESGCSLVLGEAPPERASLRIERGPQTRWAEVRFVRIDAGDTRVGVQFEAEPLAFLD